MSGWLESRPVQHLLDLAGVDALELGLGDAALERSLHRAVVDEVGGGDGARLLVLRELPPELHHPEDAPRCLQDQSIQALLRMVEPQLVDDDAAAQIPRFGDS